MAKTGSLSANLGAGSDDTLANKIVKTYPPSENVGGAVELMLAENPSAAVILISGLETDTRTLKMAAALSTGGDAVVILKRELVEGESAPRKSAPWSVEGGAAFDDENEEHVALKEAAEALCAAVKPRRTVFALLTALEDAILGVNDVTPLESVPQLALSQTDNDGEGEVTLRTGAAIAAPTVQVDQSTAPAADPTVHAFE